jgi:hypothetical protein
MYDPKSIQTFLDIVFHAVTPDDGRVLTWASKRGNPGFPISESKLTDRIDRATTPMRLYYGTATMFPTDTGELRNRQSNFAGLGVVVLDDVGTKVLLSSLPAPLRDNPTYIIETSPGNFQYGYVLTDLVRALPLAKALVSIVYASGYTDGGGNMPNKLVRLPGGVNGKPGVTFDVTLHSIHPERLWTPEALLDAVGSELTWDALVKDTDAAMRSTKKISVSAWAGVPPTSVNAGGVVDVVQEWLVEGDKVLTETDDWLTIQCPWHRDHTTSDSTAGYSPIGRGEGDYVERRGFSCFHDHCKDKKTHDFLTWVAESGGPEVGVTDAAARLVTEWAFDAPNDMVLNLRTNARVTMAAFRTLYPHTVQVFGADGKPKQVPETTLWRNSPMRLTLWGEEMNFESTSRINANEFGNHILNTYEPPGWPDKPIDLGMVEFFVDYLKYLIPDERERGLFTTWLAKKAQDPTFRGPGMLMVAEGAGVGRTTLANMIRTLFGGKHIASESFSKMISTSFNGFEEALIVQCDETLDTSSGKSFSKAYEALKELLDPRAKPVVINEKYRQPRTVTCYSSYLMFSNHTRAIYAAHNDRRLCVITNPQVPAPPAFFAKVNAWMETKDAAGAVAWGAHVWNWLLAYDTSKFNLYDAESIRTAAKDELLSESIGPVGRIIDVVLDVWPLPYIHHAVVKDLVLAQDTHYKMDVERVGWQVRQRLKERTYAFPKNVRVSVPDCGQVRPRLIKGVLTDEDDILSKGLTTADKRDIGDAIKGVDLAKVKAALADEIHTLEL